MPLSSPLLISYYFTGGPKSPRWSAYIHYAPEYNDKIGDFDDNQKLLEYCFKFSIPVMQGEGSRVQEVVRKLWECRDKQKV